MSPQLGCLLNDRVYTDIMRVQPFRNYLAKPLYQVQTTLSVWMNQTFRQSNRRSDSVYRSVADALKDCIRRPLIGSVAFYVINDRGGIEEEACYAL